MQILLFLSAVLTSLTGVGAVRAPEAAQQIEQAVAIAAVVVAGKAVTPAHPGQVIDPLAARLSAEPLVRLPGATPLAVLSRRE